MNFLVTSTSVEIINAIPLIKALTITLVLNSCTIAVVNIGLSYYRSFVHDWKSKYETMTDMIVPRSSR